MFALKSPIRVRGVDEFPDAPYTLNILFQAPVAQLDRAMAYEAIGYRFDSCRV